MAEPVAEGAPGSIVEIPSTRILGITPDRKIEEVIISDDGEYHEYTFFDVDDEGALYLPDDNRLLMKKREEERLFAGTAELNSTS